jgi:uncharacterized membrane protein YvbJ
MFCPYCGRQNDDNVVFCSFCGKVMAQKSSLAQATPSIPQSIPPVSSSPQKAKPKKPRLSDNAIKGVVTGVLVIALLIVVLWLYYPNLLPWNW